MKLVFVAACSISLLGSACVPPAPRSATPPAAQMAPTPTRALAVSLPVAAREADVEPTLRMRERGDFVVYRFSGSYRDSMVTLTQTVVGHEHGYLLVDVTVNDGGAQQRLRLRMGAEGERKGELISVAEVVGDIQRPFGVAAYGELMNAIMLSADDNQGLVDATRGVVDVAGREIYCDISIFKVRVGAHDAMLTTVSSDAFPWGHVAGEIATAEGHVLYKAEIIETGVAGPEQLASQEDIEIYEDDYDHFEE